MNAKVKLHAAKVEYSGESVGRELVFDFQCLGVTRRVVTRIGRTTGRRISREINATLFDMDVDLTAIEATAGDGGAAYRLPLSVEIAERDPVYTDTVHGETEVVLSVESTAIQEHRFDVTFIATQGSDKGRRANFRFTLQAEVIAVRLIMETLPAVGILAGHALIGSGTLAYHLDYEGNTNATADVLTPDGVFQFGLRDNAKQLLLSPSQADDLKGIFLWGEPYGSAALASPQSSAYANVATGRLHVLREEFSETRTTFRISVFLIQSVVDYIVGEFHHNLESADLGKMRLWNADAAAIERDGCASLSGTELLECRDVYGAHQYAAILRGRAEALWTRKVHKDEGIPGIIYDVILWGGGEWDYKPRIRPIWGTEQRLGNRAEIFYYDMWANFHYGCLGRTAGFALGRLVSGGNAAQIIDTGTYDPVDDVLTQEGFTLLNFTRAELLSVLERNRDDFVVEGRQAIWSSRSAQQQYMEREFAKRGIPLP